MPRTTTALFDPSTGKVPLPNILATATAADPMTGRAANTPMTPPEALAYVNKYEMGSTNAVSGMNAPIYIQFTAPVDAATVIPANIKVFMLAPDTAGTENAALGFTDISLTFRYHYLAGGTDLLMFPNFPLLPGTRYLYVVTNRVKDAAGLPLSASPYFEALKGTTALGGSFAALEPIRRNKLANDANPQDNTTNPILLSGYAKVMDDLITATATSTITKRADIALMGRFITTGAGYIVPAAAAPTSRIPVETALRSFAAGATLGGLSGKSWANTIAVTATFDRGGTNPNPDAFWALVPGAGTTAPASVGTVILGTINSGNLSIDPVLAAANAATMDLSAVTGAYNPASGVVQPFRASGNLTGYYHTTRTVPFIYMAPATAAPSGGYPLVIFQHGITSQKESIVAVAQSLTAIGRAVVAIDMPLHGALAVPGHTTGSAWGQDFMAVGAPLATRSNIQQGAFNLNRLELTARAHGFDGLGAASPSVADIKFLGHSLGGIVGTYYLAGNTTLASTGAPYTQTTLNNDMKGFLANPAGNTAYTIQNSGSFGATVDAGLLAVGITKNSPTYHQFFLVTQAVVDPADPASMTTPLAAGLPSRLSNRVMMQESTTTTYSATLGSDGLPVPTNGDLTISNAYTRYFASALGGREVLGAAGASLAPAFRQLAYTAGGTPAHAAGVVGTPFLFTLSGATPAPKVANAAVSGAATTPTEGYFQFDQTAIGHTSLLSPTASPTNTGLLQKQMRYFFLMNLVVDPTQGAPALPLAPVQIPDVQVPERFTILGH